MTTFTRVSPGTYDSTTGTWTGATTTTITGDAIQVRGDPRHYASPELILSTMPTLLFTPDTYGLLANTADFVMPGDTTDWNGVTYTVKAVHPVAPDGVVIIARVVVGV